MARDDGRLPPPWLSFFDEAELRGLAAVDQLDLGQFTRASQSAHDTLVTVRSSYTRNRLYYTLLLAQARLGARQVDTACAAAHEALDLAAALRSPPTLSLLKAFDDQLSSWNTPEARAWSERFATERARSP